MDRDWTRILPDITDESHDAEERRETHYKLFGHYPPEDPQAKCEHPMHADIRRAMNGAQIDIPFDPEEVVSDDSQLAKAFKDRYNVVFQRTKDLQRQIEEEEAERELMAAFARALREDA